VLAARTLSGYGRAGADADAGMSWSMNAGLVEISPANGRLCAAMSTVAPARLRAGRKRGETTRHLPR
jgi:hypothetical protein